MARGSGSFPRGQVPEIVDAALDLHIEQKTRVVIEPREGGDTYNVEWETV